MNGFQVALSNFHQLEDTIVYDSVSNTFINTRESSALYTDPRYITGQAIRDIFTKCLQQCIDTLSTDTCERLKSSLKGRITKISNVEEQQFLDSINELLLKEVLKDVVHEVLNMDEVLIRIFGNLTLSDVSNLAQTNQKMRQVAADDKIWYGIAQELGFDDISIGSADPKTVKQKVKEKYRALCKQISEVLPKPLPADVIVCLTQEIPSLESISFLKRLRTARDTLVVWKEVQNMIRVSALAPLLLRSGKRND